MFWSAVTDKKFTRPDKLRLEESELKIPLEQATEDRKVSRSIT